MRLAVAAVALAAAACSKPPLTVPFVARLGGVPFACGQSYAGVGASATEVQPVDLRLYVSDVELLGANGERWPFRFVPDGVWQDDTVAFLDFEDATAFCKYGTPATNTALVGHADITGTVTGIAFRIGVPDAKNHLDIATAKPPLANPELWWSWKDGYTFLRAALNTPKNGSWSLWNGSAPYTPEGDPRPAVVIEEGFTLEGGAVELDVGRLFAGVNLDLQASVPPTDLAPSCFMDFHVGDCDAVLGNLGIDWEARHAPDAAKQTFAAVTSAR